ncbi:hypothetical protein BH11PSE8_BH11PSE8_06330 [soil metagenome]
MIPYANPADRARALYRLPTAPARLRTLEIRHAREPLLQGAIWPGGPASQCVIASPADTRFASPTDSELFAGQSFDLVILHRTLDDLSAAGESTKTPFDAGAFVGRVAALLTPGGLLAGCVTNRFDRKTLAPGRPRGAHSLGSLRGMLAAARLTDVRLFNLLPDCDSPLKLVDADPGLSRLAFRRELEGEREYMSAPAYLARRLVVELGLSRHLESAIFFWGYRAC